MLVRLCAMLFVVFLVAAGGSARVVAQDELKLEGTAFLDQEACAAGLKAEGCIFSFTVSGPVAKQLYDGLGGTAVREECTGGMEKMDENGLHCLAYDDGSYLCDFGYHFGAQRFAGSGVSC